MHCRVGLGWELSAGFEKPTATRQESANRFNCSATQLHAHHYTPDVDDGCCWQCPPVTPPVCSVHTLARWVHSKVRTTLDFITLLPFRFRPRSAPHTCEAVVYLPVTQIRCLQMQTESQCERASICSRVIASPRLASPDSTPLPPTAMFASSLLRANYIAAIAKLVPTSCCRNCEPCQGCITPGITIVLSPLDSYSSFPSQTYTKWSPQHISKSARALKRRKRHNKLSYSEPLSSILTEVNAWKLGSTYRWRDEVIIFDCTMFCKVMSFVTAVLKIASLEIASQQFFLRFLLAASTTHSCREHGAITMRRYLNKLRDFNINLTSSAEPSLSKCVLAA